MAGKTQQLHCSSLAENMLSSTVPVLLLWCPSKKMHHLDEEGQSKNISMHCCSSTKSTQAAQHAQKCKAINVSPVPQHNHSQPFDQTFATLGYLSFFSKNAAYALVPIHHRSSLLIPDITNTIKYFSK